MAADDSSDAIREVLAAPRPAPPVRGDFVTEELFEDAWLGWQAEALERAERALAEVGLIVGERRGVSGQWVPRDLVVVAMLRAEVARESALPEEHRFFDQVELDRVGLLLERLDPEVSAGSEHGPTGQFWGRASTAHHFLPPGVYEAAGMSTGEQFRLIVGPVAGRVAGEASAAFPVGSGAERTLDEVAAVLAAAGSEAPGDVLGRVQALVADFAAAGGVVAAPVETATAVARDRLDASLGLRATRLGSAASPEREASALPDRFPGR